MAKRGNGGRKKLNIEEIMKKDEKINQILIIVEKINTEKAIL